MVSDRHWGSSGMTIETYGLLSGQTVNGYLLTFFYPIFTKYLKYWKIFLSENTLHDKSNWWQIE